MRSIDRRDGRFVIVYGDGNTCTFHDFPSLAAFLVEESQTLWGMIGNDAAPSSTAPATGDTPRTDAVLERWGKISGATAAAFDDTITLARQLERESEHRWRELRQRERALEQAIRDRDARAREACTAEGRTGCSFARTVSATALTGDNLRWFSERTSNLVSKAMHYAAKGENTGERCSDAVRGITDAAHQVWPRPETKSIGEPK